MAHKRLQQLIVKNLNRFQITQDAISTLEANHVAVPKFSEPNKENSRNINRIRTNKNKPIVIVNPADKSLICTIPIICQGRLLIAEFPNLLTLYLDHSISSYNYSNDLLNQKHIIESYQSGEVVRFSNQNFYNAFLLNRINTIFYLSITLELLLNSKIPANYIYSKKGVDLSKKDIEEKLSFKEKLRLVNKILKNEKKDIDNKLFNVLIDLYAIRSNLVHPKTSDSRLKGDYSMDPISTTFSDEITKYIDGVIKTVDRWEPGLICFEDIPISPDVPSQA